jgi:hypothetical protein
MKKISFIYGAVVAIILWLAIVVMINFMDYIRELASNQKIVHLLIVPTGIIFLIFVHYLFLVSDKVLSNKLQQKDISFHKITSGYIFYGFLFGLSAVGLILAILLPS